MDDFLKKLFLLGLATVIFGTFFFPTGKVSAGANDNLSGWAWSETIGWISFNSTNQNATTDYGVTVAANGDVSGYAWSENIGWISFNETRGCPSAPCQPRFNRQTGEVSGWARACAGTVNGDCTGGSRTDGWDGWIHLGGTALDGSTYGVSVSGCDWQGWAWGSDVVGWIHFRGTNYGVVGTGDACANINQPPSATDLSVRQPDYCVSGPAAIFSWTFTDPDSGDSQSAYQLQVDDNSNFSSPEDDSGKVQSNSNSYATPLGKLKYNTTYYWRLKVWDSKGAESNWISGQSFTTPTHAYPQIDFSWAPLQPAVGETVQFTDQSSVFGGSTKASWSWTFQDANPSSSSQQNATTTFTSTGPKTVVLGVTDSDGFSCQGSKKVNARLPLPKWKEIAPF